MKIHDVDTLEVNSEIEELKLNLRWGSADIHQMKRSRDIASFSGEPRHPGVFGIIVHQLRTPTKTSYSWFLLFKV